jgi:hypothetical protein
MWTWDDEQIFDFVANETNVVVLPFGAILAYPIVPKSPLPNKWSNQKQSCHVKLHAKNEWTITSMSQTRHVPKLGVFCAFNFLVYWNWKVPSKKNGVEVIHLHHVTVSMSMVFLSNTIKFGFVPICGEKKVEKCRCRVPSIGWILGIY